MKAESPVNQREAGKVVSGGDDHNDDRELFRPDTDTATGAANIRNRTEDAPVNRDGRRVTNDGAVVKKPHDALHLAKHSTDDTHIHAEPPEAKSRESYVADARAHKETIRSESNRSTLRGGLKRIK
jgi:hypothetical protein